MYKIRIQQDEHFADIAIDRVPETPPPGVLLPGLFAPESAPVAVNVTAPAPTADVPSAIATEPRAIGPGQTPSSAVAEAPLPTPGELANPKSPGTVPA